MDFAEKLLGQRKRRIMCGSILITVITTLSVISPVVVPCSAYSPIPAALTFSGRTAAKAAAEKGIIVTGAGGVLGGGFTANLSKEQFFTADGVINLDTHVDFIGRCIAGSAHRAAFHKEFLKGAKDCGLDLSQLHRRKRSSPAPNAGLLDPFKLACITACIHKKLQIMTKHNDFQRSESKLRRVLEHSKIFDLEGEKLKRIVAHIALCSKITPPFQERSCITALPFAACAIFGTIRACGKTD